MIVTAGDIWDEVMDAARMHSKPTLESIRLTFNLAYIELASRHPWTELRNKTTVDFSAADVVAADGIFTLPSNLAGICGVYDEDYEYLPTEWHSAVSDKTQYDTSRRYFRAGSTAAPLATLTGITLNEGATTFAGGSWDAAYIGEYVSFGREMGRYLLTDTRTFTPAYQGPAMQGAPGEYAFIRPAGTPKMGIVDWQGDNAAASVDLYWWEVPVPLYKPWEPIRLPSSRALELLTFIRYLGTKDRKEASADRYRVEYEKAYSEMVAMCPRFISPKPPMARDGRRVRFS